MTDQEIIDDIYAKLQAQGGPGYDRDKGRCTYLDKAGNKCAVGLYIPDGHPAQNSGLDAEGLFKRYPDLRDEPVLRERSPTWWDRAQDCHDLAADRSKFFEAFRYQINASPAIDAQL